MDTIRSGSHVSFTFEGETVVGTVEEEATPEDNRLLIKATEPAEGGATEIDITYVVPVGEVTIVP